MTEVDLSPRWWEGIGSVERGDRTCPTALPGLCRETLCIFPLRAQTHTPHNTQTYTPSCTRTHTGTVSSPGDTYVDAQTRAETHIQRDTRDTRHTHWWPHTHAVSQWGYKNSDISSSTSSPLSLISCIWDPSWLAHQSLFC